MLKFAPENLKGILAFLVVLFSFAYYFVITIILDKSADQQVIIAIITANSTVLQYYFGASQGSNKKDEIIAQKLDSNQKVTTEVSGDKTKITTEPVDVKTEDIKG